MRRTLYEADHQQFRAGYRSFLEREVAPNDAAWEAAGLVDRQLFLKAGKAGLIGTDVPESLGGGGVRDFRFNAIIAEAAAELGLLNAVMGIGLVNDVCLPYFLGSA